MPASGDPAYAAAYQGAPGAYGEEAALELLGGAGAPPRLLACARFADVFDALREGRARLGVVPVENSLAGAVTAVGDLLRERPVRVVGEVVRRISHCVAARPGAPLEGIRRVHSHPVALVQCRLFFGLHPWLRPVEAYDTAGAMEWVMAEGGSEEAALGSRRAAALYGAAVLAHPVEDRSENFTRFLALALRS